MRYRKGQIWSDPTGNFGYTVVEIEPLRITGWGIPRLRFKQAALNALDRAELEARFPRLYMQPSATPDEIRAGLIGRTITSVEVYVDEGDWAQGDGDLTLTLDDGNTVSISSWGYDAWGTGVEFESIPDPGKHSAQHVGRAE